MNKSQLHKIAIEKRRKRDKDRRVRDIMNAAQKVLLSGDYINWTMDDIAMEAGITKPTIYRYFKNKDHLCYSLWHPLIDELIKQIEIIENKLVARQYASGAQMIHDFFMDAYYHAYRASPDSFRLIQFFMQTGSVWNLDQGLSLDLHDKGKRNARIGRRVYRLAVEQGLIRDYDVQDLQDVIYAIFIGIVQLSDIKSHKTGLRSDQQELEADLVRRLSLAEKLVADALVLN
ncbi:MAG: TetR/AcrR family transcriptional regulator; helix-turn-helix transcriptional regulator [Proteobacteria bacterium]|nr:TetR/AcrR family transcriptional regulator; helix-turn-helix transcriptional regulator [Pseudomonadota bacterium]